MINRRMLQPPSAAFVPSPSLQRVGRAAQYLTQVAVPPIGPMGNRPPGGSRAASRRPDPTEAGPAAPSSPFRTSALHRLVRHLVTDENFARRVQKSPQRAFQGLDYLNDHVRHILGRTDPDLARKLAQAALDYAVSQQAGDVDVFGHDEAMQALQAIGSVDDVPGGGQ